MIDALDAAEASSEPSPAQAKQQSLADTLREAAKVNEEKEKRRAEEEKMAAERRAAGEGWR
jgi:hypothetical protein